MSCRLPLSVLAVLILLTGLVTGCGGGGGGGGGTTEPPLPAPIVFTPSGGSPANSITIAQGPNTSGTTLELEIRVNSVQDLYGVAFDLEYPSNILRPSAGLMTSFLNNDNTQISFVSGLAREGVLVVGYTRLGAVPGVSGSGYLVRMTFTAIATGSGTIRFSRNSAFNSRGATISDLTWSGGTVQVNRLTP